jgi:hypothetical protein
VRKEIESESEKAKNEDKAAIEVVEVKAPPKVK